MPNPTETQVQMQRLVAAVKPLTPRVMAIDGVNGVGVGLSAAAARRRGTAESVRPEDIVIKVLFRSQEAMAKAEPVLHELFGQLPLECEFVGVIRSGL